MQSKFAEDLMTFFKILRSSSALVLIFFLFLYITSLWQFLFLSIESFKIVSIIDITILTWSSLMKIVFRLAKLLFPEL